VPVKEADPFCGEGVEQTDIKVVIRDMGRERENSALAVTTAPACGDWIANLFETVLCACKMRLSGDDKVVDDKVVL